MSEEALQIAEKRRDAKGKGEWERHFQLNAEFQRIARRDKNAVFNEQCKEIEESNRMGKIRDLFKKIGDTKGPPDAKKSKIKEINGKRLRRGGKNTHKCTKKVLMTQITTMVLSLT